MVGYSITSIQIPLAKHVNYMLQVNGAGTDNSAEKKKDV